MERRYWMMKTEPGVYSIEDLERDGRTGWEGVRNYQVRNYMRDEMRVGDEALVYHSSADPAGVAGVARVCRAAYPDATARDPKNPYYDPRETEDRPRWLMVDVEFVERFPRLVPLAVLRRTPGLEEMEVLRRGSRLSVHPVTAEEFRIVRELGHAGD